MSDPHHHLPGLALTDRGQHAVVIDIDEVRTNMIQLQELREFVPALHGDAAVTRHLQEAGLQHPSCAGVVALTDHNDVNLKIAITSKLLNPKIRVICRADSHDVEANMASFGTDHIVDPFDTFASHLAVAFQAPCLYLLQRWLTGPEGTDLTEPVYPPQTGHWIVCGYGRFGKAVCAKLQSEGLEVTVVEARPDKTGRPETMFVAGRGTEAVTLEAAGIEAAAGLVAGTDDDANNLSIVMTARELNPKVFVVVRQNQHDNREIIAAVNAEMVMHPSAIIADKIRVLLATPILNDFMSLACRQDNDWACELVSRISALVKNRAPNLHEVCIDEDQAKAVVEVLDKGHSVSLKDLLRDPWKRRTELKCITLFMLRDGEPLLLPADDIELRFGDRLLFCAGREGFTRLYWNLQHDNVLSYARLGRVEHHGWLWKKLFRK